MPSRPAKKFNARFPPARIKKIMQADEQIGKVAAAVPIIVSRSLESFAELLLKRINDVTMSRNAKTVTPSHIKQVIMSDSRFHFLVKYVEGIPDTGVDVDLENNAHSATNEDVCGTTFPAYTGDVAGRSLAEICLMTGVTHQ